MKVRKLAVALALAGGLGSGVAQALGLGEIELQSYLNEPLDAKIVLSQSRGVDPGDVFVNIAPESAYERVGLSRNQFLSKLRFKVITASDGRLAVDVSSREPLREPYLNFLLELTWPNGRLMREYAVLVDPPVYAEGSGVQESVAAPSVTSAPASTGSVGRAQPGRSSGTAGGYQGNTFGPTGASDNLWTIASRIRPNNSVSMQQVMLAVQDLNPDAFIDGNINRLKRGQVLRVPSLDQIQSRTRAQAIQVVARQNQEFQSPEPERTVDATADTGQAASAPAATQDTGGGELKLLVADTAAESSETGSAGGDGKLPGGVDAGAAIALEELESARRENEELNNRVEDLQGQVETLKRLLELKNSELADLQQVVSSDPSETLPDTAVEPAPEASDMAESAEAEGDGSAVEGAEDVMAEGTDEQAANGGITPESGGAAEAKTGDMAAEASADQQDAAVPEAVPAVTESAEAPEPVAPAPKPAPEAEKGFPANIIDAITSNPMYQIALGGGLVLLLLVLLLVARRNANREKAFYEQLEGESDEGDDAFDLDLEEDAGTKAGEDPLAEADSLVSFGRHDQAVEVLETAISREPARTDLRLKLLGVYADTEDRDSFEKQFGEIQALEDEEALASALEMRARLEEAESIPSIDDLESQLRSDSFRAPQEDENPVDESATAVPASTESEPKEDVLSEELLADQYDSLPGEDLPGVGPEENAEDSDDGVIEYDLSDISLESDDGEQASASEETDESLFDVDLDEVPEAAGDSGELTLDFTLDEDEPAGEEESDNLAGEGLESLDESFLDELDAELDKVVSDDEETDAGDDEEALLGDLELDISDEDISLIEELSDPVPAPGEDEPDDSAEVDLADLENLEDLSSLEGLDSLDDDSVSEDDLDIDDLPVASEGVAEESSASTVVDIDEKDLGDEDDFDFLAGADEAATKLDLARAYVEMGDHEGARDILEEVAIEGNEEQKSEARELLKNIS